MFERVVMLVYPEYFAEYHRLVCMQNKVVVISPPVIGTLIWAAIGHLVYRTCRPPPDQIAN